MKKKSFFVIAATSLIVVIGAMISINGCGTSLVGTTATSAQQAQTALDKGDYTTAVSEATKVIDNPSSTNDEKADAYTVVGQAKLGEVLASKNTTTAKIMTAVADNIATKGENMSAIAPDLIIEPTLKSIASLSSIKPFDLPPVTTIEADRMLTFIKNLIMNVQMNKYKISSSDIFNKVMEGLVALENVFNYWSNLTPDQKKENISTKFVEDVCVITTLVTWAFSKDNISPIENEDAMTPDIKDPTTGPDEIKTRWFKINDVDPASIVAGTNPTPTAEIQSKFRNGMGGVTNRIYDIAKITTDESFSTGDVDKDKTIKDNAATLKIKIDEFNALFYNGRKPTYSDLQVYILHKK